jgi:hypothetical protein
MAVRPYASRPVTFLLSPDVNPFRTTAPQRESGQLEPNPTRSRSNRSRARWTSGRRSSGAQVLRSTSMTMLARLQVTSVRSRNGPVSAAHDPHSRGRRESSRRPRGSYGLVPANSGSGGEPFRLSPRTGGPFRR